MAPKEYLIEFLKCWISLFELNKISSFISDYTNNISTLYIQCVKLKFLIKRSINNYKDEPIIKI